MLSVYESDYLYDKSDDYGFYSGSAGTCSFPFRFEDSAGPVDDSIGRVGDSFGRVCGVGSGFFVLMGIKSIGDVVPLVVYVPIGVESKGVRLIEIFWRLKS